MKENLYHPVTTSLYSRIIRRYIFTNTLKTGNSAEILVFCEISDLFMTRLDQTLNAPSCDSVTVYSQMYD